MRVLMVSNDYLPNPGGIAAHVYELSRALGQLGHEVDLIAGHREDHAAGQAASACTGVRLVRNKAFAWNTPGYVAEALDTCRLIRRLRQQRAYDVCHWHNLVWETWSVAAAAGPMPRVFTNHSSGYLRRMKTFWRRKLQLPVLLARADQVITPSRELGEQSVAVGYPAARVRYIPNGVDVDVFTPGQPDPALSAKYGLIPADRVIVVPRRLDPKNGVDVLVRAMPALHRRVPRAKLLLVGDGEQRALLEALVQELAIQSAVVFCGSQPRTEVLRHLHLGHVAALPSRAEAVSLAGLEAMSAGLPVVGSRVGGIPEFVDDPATGRLVRVDDPEDLARALGEILVQPVAEIRRMGARARERVGRDFSWLSCARQVLEVYESAIRARAASA